MKNFVLSLVVRCRMLIILGIRFFLYWIYKVSLFVRDEVDSNTYYSNLSCKFNLKRNRHGVIGDLLSDYKIKALDIGAQQGIEVPELKKYKDHFDFIMVEPIAAEAAKLKDCGFTVIEKAFWSKKCKKTLHLYDNRSGA